ncbi:uncharacterized protein [Antedon mediterranea]|uniref:uncharacterized protein n=1 Tax=Antedon mediterranea TaxID=105859 RepID=UPI003AF483C3
MSHNFLKLNDDKTEFIIFASPHQKNKCKDLSFSIGECEIDQAPYVKNLGILIDSSMTMSTKISRITSRSTYHLRNIRRIRRYISREATRIITETRKFDHITPILKDLHWLPVSYRIIFKILLITFKTLNGEGPQYLRDLLVRHAPAQNLRSSSLQQLIVPRSRHSWGDRSVAATCLWNALPSHIRSSKSTDVFKSALKTHLLSKFVRLLFS